MRLWSLAWMARLNRDCRIHGLSQTVQDVGTQCSRSFEKVAQRLRRDSRIGGYFAHQATAAMNRAAKMPTERVFRLGFHHAVVPLGQLGKLVGDFRPIPA